MNTKQVKKIRRKAKTIMVQWLHSLLPEHEKKLINEKNVLDLAPKQTHYVFQNQVRLSAWSFKWVVKKLKHNPELTIDTLNDMLQPTEQQLRRNKMIEEGPIKNDK